MVWIRVEVVGDADEVDRVLGHLGGATVRVPDGERTPAMGQDRSETNPVLEPSAAEISPAPLSSGWTEELASDFTASLDAVARRMALYVWRAGTAGIHRRALCQRAELTLAELRSLLMRMGHALRRFQRERGMTLSRPVAANSPLQSYFVDPDFAAVADSEMFGEEGSGPAGRGLGAPLMDHVVGLSGEATVHRLWNALLLIIVLWTLLACGVDDDDRMVRSTPNAWWTPTPPCTG